MSRRFTVCTAHEVVRVLRWHGFFFVDQRGSHQKWRHPAGRQAIVAQHGSKPIRTGTPKHIIKGSGLDVDDFR